MANLTVQAIAATGTTPSYAAASGGGDKVTPSARTFLHVKNGGGASILVTIDDNLSVGPAGAASFNADLAVQVNAGTEKMIGPITETRFRGVDGKAAITYSGVTSVTIAAFKL